MQQAETTSQPVDIEALKAQVDAEIAAKLREEAEYARHIHRRGITVGELRLLIGADVASEVARMPQLFHLPGAPAGVRGLANRHGRVVPVVDLSALFGTPYEVSANSWLLVHGHGDDAVGIIMDGLPDRKRFAQDDQVDLEEVSHPIAVHAKAAYREGGEIWIDLDMGALFASVFNISPDEE